jgi:hypothetical protein
MMMMMRRKSLRATLAVVQPANRAEGREQA